MPLSLSGKNGSAHKWQCHSEMLQFLKVNISFKVTPKDLESPSITYVLQKRHMTENEARQHITEGSKDFPAPYQTYGTEKEL